MINSKHSRFSFLAYASLLLLVSLLLVNCSGSGGGNGSNATYIVTYEPATAIPLADQTFFEFQNSGDDFQWTRQYA